MSRTLKVISAVFLILLITCLIGVTYLEIESHKVKSYAGEFCQTVNVEQELPAVLGKIRDIVFYRVFVDESNGKYWVIIPGKDIASDFHKFVNGKMTVVFRTKSPTTYSCVIEVQNSRTRKATLLGGS
ncbi:hypothetical protein [Bdellovibrio sp. KM01]|uniref:hypothetical protein n=1 Tax=Bdellovibrio sp. KM01 TaxID=2748865 RepID=UPI0015EADC4C|nr:hypothetical protein [Bdellovibrio sp. KM01]QLY25201.1 hypothetical protein HW988_17560 [Bdellovibrio sp. KM01]